MNSGMAGRRVAVVGAGIAGPTAAVCLSRLGSDVTVYEAYSRRVEEVGSFLNLAPNGRAVLEQLGIADRVLEAGSVATEIAFGNHRGRTLAVNPETTTNVMRGDLSAALRAAATDAGATVVRDKRLTSLREQSDGAWTLGFADDTTADVDIVLGCDGVNSDVRPLLLPDAPGARYTGVVGSGGVSVVPGDPPVDGRFHMTFGLRGFFGYQVVEPGLVYWFENHHEPQERTFAELAAVPDAEWVAALVERHRPDPEFIGTVIAHSESVGHWPVHEVPPLTQWHRGSATVLGDAAHAVAPHLGQGAALGMEDAYELACILARESDVPRAFTQFEDSRRDRIAAMATQAQRTGAVMTPSSGLVRVIRDLTLPMAIKKGVKKGTQAYAYRPTEWVSPAESM